MKYTYFIREVESGLMKIGRSEDPTKRFRGLQVSSPRNLEFVMATTLVTESDCHKRFTESRIRGEWFLPSEELAGFIADLLSDATKYPSHFILKLSDENKQKPIRVDLSKLLTKEEIKRFNDMSDKAGAEDITEHFLNVFVRPFETAAKEAAQ